MPSTEDYFINPNKTTYEIYTKKDVETGLPVGKKNNPCWNFISQENALKVSANMNKESQAVTSSLIDSYAWDTIVEWITKNEDYKNLGDDSSNSRNYKNNDKINLSNALYALHRYGEPKNTNVKENWWYATKYNKGPITLGTVNIDAISGAKYEFANNNYDSENYVYYLRKELATGLAEETKINNIYDLAGNMWEWTTETGKPDESDVVSAVYRGGSFHNDGSLFTISYREGNAKTYAYDIDLGFRVVLYIQ